MWLAASQLQQAKQRVSQPSKVCSVTMPSSMCNFVQRMQLIWTRKLGSFCRCPCSTIEHSNTCNRQLCICGPGPEQACSGLQLQGQHAVEPSRVLSEGQRGTLPLHAKYCLAAFIPTRQRSTNEVATRLQWNPGKKGISLSKEQAGKLHEKLEELTAALASKNQISIPLGNRYMSTFKSHRTHYVLPNG